MTPRPASILWTVVSATPDLSAIWRNRYQARHRLPKWVMPQSLASIRPVHKRLAGSGNSVTDERPYQYHDPLRIAETIVCC